MNWRGYWGYLLKRRVNKMKRIYAKHLPYTDGHLGKVALDMEHAGAHMVMVAINDRIAEIAGRRGFGYGE
jgi:hypothetical protein